MLNFGALLGINQCILTLTQSKHNTTPIQGRNYQIHSAFLCVWWTKHPNSGAHVLSFCNKLHKYWPKIVKNPVKFRHTNKKLRRTWREKKISIHLWWGVHAIDWFSIELQIMKHRNRKWRKCPFLLLFDYLKCS